jgi:hypothetical protein
MLPTAVLKLPYYFSSLDEKFYASFLARYKEEHIFIS